MWECKETINNNDDMCGNLIASNHATIGNLDSSIFATDSTAPPNKIYFNMEMVSSAFRNITGLIFNFNPLDGMVHYIGIILQADMFITVNYFVFNHNGDFSADQLTTPHKEIYYVRFIMILYLIGIVQEKLVFIL